MGGGKVRGPLFFPNLIMIHPEVFSENGLTQVNLVLLLLFGFLFTNM